MFSKLFIAAFAGFATVASAVPTGDTDTPTPGTCSTSPAQCCQNVSNSNDAGVASLVKGLLGIDLSGLNVPIGTGCTAIDVLGGVQCNQNTVYCGDVYQSALIAINCIPIIINL